jgi:hypothetical protein
LRDLRGGFSWIESAVDPELAGGICAVGGHYGFFGFMWIAARVVPEFKEVINPGVVRLFLTWLVLCFVATYTNVLPIANAAHLAGLFTGALVGAFVMGRRSLAGAGFSALMACSGLGLFWAPWTSSWTTDEALKAYAKRDFKRAEHWTRRSIENGADKAWCWATLMRIATAARNKTSYSNALENLRLIDPAGAERTDKEMQSFW